MQAPVTHFLPLATIRRERMLLAPGKVVVRKGQKVVATDTVAEAELAPTHVILDVCRGLGLSPEQADKETQVRMGDTVAEGDVLVGPVGITRRVMRSPGNGKVVVVEAGQILIALAGKPYELKAGIPGVVVDLMADRGVVIETTGAVLQGVWGNGLVDSGPLTFLAKTPAHELTPDRLDASMRGSVIAAGYLENGEVLHIAADIPLKGMILASMHPTLIPQANALPFPLILVEGFGPLAMNTAAYKLLQTSEGREASCCGEEWNPLRGKRPEVVIALPAPDDVTAPKEMDHFAAGQLVRALRAPFQGQTGVISYLEERALFPSGIRAAAASIRFEDGSNELVPLANLEIIE